MRGCRLHECPDALGVMDDIVRIHPHHPVTRRLIEGELARGGEVLVPGEIEHLLAVVVCDRFRAVIGTGIDDDDLIDMIPKCIQAAGKCPFFILDNQCDRDGHHSSLSGYVRDLCQQRAKEHGMCRNHSSAGCFVSHLVLRGQVSSLA